MAGYLAGDVDEWIYIDIEDQHEDSIRFIKDCEKAIGKEIKILKSKEYRCVEDCIKVFGGFKDARNNFAPCTNWLKKRVRKEWEYYNRKKRTGQTGQWNIIRKQSMSFHSLKRNFQKRRFMDCSREHLILQDRGCTNMVIQIITAWVASRAEWGIGTGSGKISRRFSKAEPS